MKIEKINHLFALIHNIREAINGNELMTALSLSNDLYFYLLRLVIDEAKNEDDKHEH